MQVYIVILRFMSKDFSQIINQSVKDNQKFDPYVYVTPELNELIYSLYLFSNSKFLISYLGSNLLVAPLQTIATSLQLSVQKHRNIYQSQQAKTKQLAKLNTELTIHQKRKFELMLRAGGKTIPYTAPVYDGYKQAIEGLKNQGWKAFYKGLGFRTITSLFYLIPFLNPTTPIANEQVERGFQFKLLKLFGSCLLIDNLMNPLYTLENRYILQNNIREFRVIRKPFSTFHKIVKTGEGFKGIGYHFLNNFIGFFTRFPLYFSFLRGQKITSQSYLTYLAGQSILYPFLTSYRRLQCQSQKYPGMIPVRYSGLLHTIRVMAYEEGVKGLWRAYPLHVLLNTIKLKILQVFLFRQQVKPQ